ncbi:MAG: hypothetical protein ACHQFZ_10370 [Acidimicrobiales bacterium]
MGPLARPSITARGRATVVATVALSAGAVLGLGGPAAALSRAARASTAGVSLALPAGWTSRSSAVTLTVARSGADLGAAAPSHGRLTVRALGCGAVDLNAILTKDTATVTSVSAPTTISLAGHSAASITFTSNQHGRSVETQDVVMPLSRSRAYEFTLESATANWSASSRALLAIARTARFTSIARCP